MTDVYFSRKRILEAAVHTDPGLLSMAVYQPTCLSASVFYGLYHEGCPWSQVGSGAPAWTGCYVGVSDGRQEGRRKGLGGPSQLCRFYLSTLPEVPHCPSGHI